ncbi:phosphoribosylformylglycinamidine synthase I [Methanoregula boonei 6A8]|jgi:phosphoribosylformylglycinamidine synthase|uniref:Phosphoribosylformylglycinamidine synthase I n=1 Tax=Methanoregula boonei (strain DSM 21154 / JCM 14090 / 6A8) TaxID=456442 RepID=A7I5I0_METB6|nr:phosphoribosylformylglycinamidine synthase subunit PurQ [Methanoregula boonei]ABS54991.1 phosphoribosylformylglycinamidine synthase I [Methanoregula boonei 6A8]
MPSAHAPPSQRLIGEKALIMSGYGINSEMETREALFRAGMDAEIVHINDLIAKRVSISDYRLLVFPGGFSYGDDTGAGNAYANRVRNNLWDDLLEFLDGDNLVLGICNGFQILANLGLVPAFDRSYVREIALMPNRSGRLECRFVTIRPASDTIWTHGIVKILCPVSHGEGNLSCSAETLQEIKRNRQIAFTYCRDDLSPAGGEYPYNPNGSVEDIAGLTSKDGKVLGMMPHPERAMEFTNLYDWPLLKEQMRRSGERIPGESLNMAIFKNIVRYFE